MNPMHPSRFPGLPPALALALLIGLGLPPADLTAANRDSTAGAPESTGMSAVQEIAAEFFEWRRFQQPVSGDDIPRVERPDGWVPDWSAAALDTYRRDYQRFFRAVESLDTRGWDVAAKVDARLLRAAIQRVHWELDILGAPHRNPLFYVQQTLGSVFELLIVSSPMNEVRGRNIILRLEQIPATLNAARANLDRPVRPFARAAIDSLSGIGDRLRRLESALAENFPPDTRERLGPAIAAASTALQEYAAWLESGLGSMQTAFAVGPIAYQWFLTNVALIPHGPDELLSQGRLASNRAVAWEAVEQNRNRELPPAPLFETAERQIRSAELQEAEIRAFLESQNLMTVPDWLGHYRFCALPGPLEPLAFLGVTDDLTSEYRLGEDACRYIRKPSDSLSYFALSAARDPRPLIIHEGIPGHYFQLAQSWRQSDPIRRRYIDSSVNEGIGLYVEELLLQAGLFDFSPLSREIIWNFMRLRALRVEVDIRLAVGDMTIQQAADHLARAAPMDRATAMEEAVFFAFNPGQAISYQVGKLQIIRFLADARLARGEDFSLRDFHDYLMRNGNVPIALQRWEYLGDDGDLLRLDALGGKPVTVPQ
jgi:hypothetical protein